MNVHKNARLTPQGRLLMVRRVEQGWKMADAAWQPACPSVVPMNGSSDIGRAARSPFMIEARRPRDTATRRRTRAMPRSSDCAGNA
jgi:hypothetical protein